MSRMLTCAASQIWDAHDVFYGTLKSQPSVSQNYAGLVAHSYLPELTAIWGSLSDNVSLQSVRFTVSFDAAYCGAAAGDHPVALQGKPWPALTSVWWRRSCAIVV